MSTPAPAPEATRTGSDSDITHLYCCDPDTALCGEDLAESPEVPYGVGVDCVVCEDLDQLACSNCGYPAP